MPWIPASARRAAPKHEIPEPPGQLLFFTDVHMTDGVMVYALPVLFVSIMLQLAREKGLRHKPIGWTRVHMVPLEDHVYCYLPTQTVFECALKWPLFSFFAEGTLFVSHLQKKRDLFYKTSSLMALDAILQMDARRDVTKKAMGALEKVHVWEGTGFKEMQLYSAGYVDISSKGRFIQPVRLPKEATQFFRKNSIESDPSFFTKIAKIDKKAL
jgi:hypothetical protein